MNGSKKQREGTVGGTKGYPCENKFSWKCRKCRLLFFLSSACLSFSVRVHDSKNIIPCTECTFVGDLTEDFTLAKNKTSVKSGSVSLDIKLEPVVNQL